ncbi:MAG: SRPBCC family protein [Candidatus Binatia bacterium]
MQHVEVKRRFRAPVEEVWARYTDHADWKNWAGFTSSWLEKEGRPDKNGIGCVRGFGSNGVNVYEEVVEWEPTRRFAYKITRGGLPMKNHYGEEMFEPDGDGTLLTWRCRFDSRIPGLGWVMQKFIERIFRGGLDGLSRKYFPDR